MKLALTFLTLALLGTSRAQLPPPQPPQAHEVATVKPTPKGFTPENFARLKAPAGFRLKVFAEGLGNARLLHVMQNGDVYLTRRESNDVLLLRDTNHDGVIDRRVTVAQNLPWVNGVDSKGGKLYLAARTQIVVADILQDGTLSTPRVFVDNLPVTGQHANRSLAWGPDGYLYLSIGSTCNDCNETNPENATLVRINPDGKSREVFARGLRNTIGFGWHPVTKVLYGLDQGSDWHGDDQPPEELNRIARGNNYGWPFCYGDKQVDNSGSADPPGDVTRAAYCPTTTGALLTYTAHAAAIQMAYYTGSQFPGEYKNDAFVAFRGSWNRSTPSGYEVARVHFDSRGRPQSITPFVTGWLYMENGQPAEFGRVAGVAQYVDGSLLISDDQNGVIYRVLYGK